MPREQKPQAEPKVQERLDDELEDTFPASDPLSVTRMSPDKDIVGDPRTEEPAPPEKP